MNHQQGQFSLNILPDPCWSRLTRTVCLSCMFRHQHTAQYELDHDEIQPVGKARGVSCLPAQTEPQEEDESWEVLRLPLCPLLVWLLVIASTGGQSRVHKSVLTAKNGDSRDITCVGQSQTVPYTLPLHYRVSLVMKSHSQLWIGGGGHQKDGQEQGSLFNQEKESTDCHGNTDACVALWHRLRYISCLIFSPLSLEHHKFSKLRWQEWHYNSHIFKWLKGFQQKYAGNMQIFEDCFFTHWTTYKVDYCWLTI